MIETKTFSFKNNIDEITNCDIYYNDDIYNDDITQKKYPFVLLLHGFRAFSNWGFFPYFATKLAENGFISGCLDFSLNTLLDRDKQLFDMGRFRKNTVTQMITEAKMLIDNLQSNITSFAIDNFADRWNNEVYLIGHSLGGALAIAVADSINANNTNRDNINANIIKKLVTICSISDIDIYTIRQKEKWEEIGYKEFTDNNTGQNIILDVEFLRDRLTYINEKSLASMISRLTMPTYFIHTEADATVSPKSLDILSASFTNKKLLKTELVPKANHLLNCDHPFNETNSALSHMATSKN